MGLDAIFLGDKDWSSDEFQDLADGVVLMPTRLS